MFLDKTVNAARGKWRGILVTLGLPEACLKNQHGPCPLCGGKDRFRWDNAEGRGTYICGQCGSGDGMTLAMKYTGKPFREVAPLIDGMVGNLKPEAPKPAKSEDKRRDVLGDTYKATVPVQPGDLVHRYLETRGVEELVYPEALRFAPKLRDGEGGIRPAMVAMIAGPDGKPVSMHRTFLRPDGLGKAEMGEPRKLMPGTLPVGACVRLCDYVPGGPLGIAEGIETALSASALWEMPVWAAISSSILKKWTPADGCTEVAVFGDNDTKFGGQAAAYAVAHRLAVKGISVTIHVPPDAGTDWNDVWMARCQARDTARCAV